MTDPVPDPRALTERSSHARARGLSAPYVPGGEDPELAETLRRERRLVRLLIAMAIAVVLAGFVLGTIATIVGPPAGS